MSKLVVKSIKHPTADSDSIQLSVDGTITFNKVVNIDSNSSVGIGTTTPSHQLHLKEKNNSEAGIFIEATNATTGYEIARTNATGYLDLKGTQNTYSGFTFSTTDGSGTTSERVQISNSGNVGIGTTTPSTPLEITTTNKLGATFTGNINGEGLTVTQTDYTSGNYISLVEAAYDDGNKANPNVRIGAKFDGGGASLAFGTSNNYITGITNTAMLINNYGHVTKPDQPLFVGRLESQTSTASSYVIGVSQLYNRSMTFNATNDRITVPTSGYYLIHAQQLFQATAAVFFQVRVNSSSKWYGYKPSSTTNRDLVANGIWYLNANDYVEFYVGGTSIYSWGGGHSLCYVQLLQ